MSAIHAEKRQERAAAAPEAPDVRNPQGQSGSSGLAGSGAGDRAAFDSALGELRETVQACMQCGTCTASCPNSFAMDVTPRQMWRLVQFGMVERILHSRTYWFCSSCYMCTLRCPRGLKLTQAMSALKRLAQLSGHGPARRNAAFYTAFMDNVRRHGRAQETALMSSYFLRSRDPLLPFRYVPLGLRMLGRGKLHPPSLGRSGDLGLLFEKARDMETPGTEDRP